MLALRLRASACRVALPLLSATNFRQLGLATLHGGFPARREAGVSTGSGGGLRLGINSNICGGASRPTDARTGGAKTACGGGGITGTGGDWFD